MACPLLAEWGADCNPGGERVTDDRADLEHRVRTELTTISLVGQLIRRDGLASDRQRRLAAEILGACNRLQQILDEWLGRDDPPPPA